MSMHAANTALASKYDPGHERDVIDWVQNLLGVTLTPGMNEMKNQLSNGQVLVKLVQRVYAGTPSPPAKATQVIKKLKVNTMEAPFKKMENIQNFLNAIEAYGVQKTGLFQTVDLYEGRNMAQVLNSILQLGSEAQRNGFQGMTIGPKPTEKNIREFSDEQLKAGQGIIGLQAGSNKGASQKGMSTGVRHIADIKVDEMSKEGQGVIGLQAGSNKGASQSGMNIGGGRGISDIKVDAMSSEGQGIIGLQAGSNKGASQSGMNIGGTRHVADIKVDSMSAEGQGVIGLQAGSNKGASQSGSGGFGGVRHVADIKCDGYSQEGQGMIGLQAGSNQGASQAGMNMGNQRHIVD